MLAEECELNEFLEKQGIETVESDLGERILQLMHKKPSHIVLPAIHIKKEEIGELFVREMGTEPGNNDQTYLTHAARKNLRQKFIHAEAAMTGANFAVAETGECVVCTNEGNADMGTSQPKLQITAFGLEKIVPDRRSLGVFTRLLARSATGQPVTTCPFGYRATGHHLYLPLPETTPGRRTPYHHRGQRPHKHTGRRRPCQDSQLPEMRCLHEYLSGLPAQRRLQLYLFYTRTYRHQSGHA